MRTLLPVVAVAGPVAGLGVAAAATSDVAADVGGPGVAERGPAIAVAALAAGTLIGAGATLWSAFARASAPAAVAGLGATLVSGFVGVRSGAELLTAGLEREASAQAAAARRANRRAAVEQERPGVPAAPTAPATNDFETITPEQALAAERAAREAPPKQPAPNPATVAAAKDEPAPKAPEPAPADTPAAPSSPSAPAAAAQPRAGAVLTPAQQLLSDTSLLQVGMRGPQIAALRQRLAELHYIVPADKDPQQFTPALADAVMAFQKVNGLDRDGQVGPQTRKALALPRAFTPGRGEPTRIIVDKHLQVAVYVRDNKVVRIYNAATGNPRMWPDKPGERGFWTPNGTFRIYAKPANDDLNGKTGAPSPGTTIDGKRYRAGQRLPDDGVDMPTRVSPLGALYNPNFFVGGYALHGSKSVPAYAASHGCVRLPIWASGKMFADATIGTQVIVRGKTAVAPGKSGG